MNDRLAECYARAWQKTFDYKGRATRKEFWSFILVNTAPFIFSSAVLFILISWINPYVIMAIFGVVLSLIFPFLGVIIFPFLSLGVRRMHDIGRSGWWFFSLLIASILFFPVAIVLLYLCSKPSIRPHPDYIKTHYYE